ncbi:hypothetical protein BDN70DRAFT_101364 [Pholiota conissans]|uniref:Uncharacterized protein n=1 Tax=Pholiota conissans TaxID=109636 RepID=A0A9P5Z156_9AGAR|nr:hypothetical protein BDN70DRAFT_101364 [Pholiota conissans]
MLSTRFLMWNIFCSPPRINMHGHYGCIGNKEALQLRDIFAHRIRLMMMGCINESFKYLQRHIMHSYPCLSVPYEGYWHYRKSGCSFAFTPSNVGIQLSCGRIGYSASLIEDVVPTSCISTHRRPSIANASDPSMIHQASAPISVIPFMLRALLPPCKVNHRRCQNNKSDAG